MAMMVMISLTAQVLASRGLLASRHARRGAIAGPAQAGSSPFPDGTPIPPSEVVTVGEVEAAGGLGLADERTSLLGGDGGRAAG